MAERVVVEAAVLSSAGAGLARKLENLGTAVFPGTDMISSIQSDWGICLWYSYLNLSPSLSWRELEAHLRAVRVDQRQGGEFPSPQSVQ